jgi:hypothetical protein
VVTGSHGEAKQNGGVETSMRPWIQQFHGGHGNAYPDIFRAPIVLFGLPIAWPAPRLETQKFFAMICCRCAPPGAPARPFPSIQSLANKCYAKLESMVDSGSLASLINSSVAACCIEYAKICMNRAENVRAITRMHGP